MSRDEAPAEGGGVLDIDVAPLPPRPEKGGNLRHKFSKTEDETLRKLVAQHGDSNWTMVAAGMKNRTPRQCRERFKNYLSPTIKNGPWTPEEEALLERKYKEIGPRWAKIALSFEQRSDVNVKNHWTAMANRQIRERQMAAEKNDVIQQMDASVRPRCGVPDMFSYGYNPIVQQQVMMQNQMYLQQMQMQLQMQQMQMYQMPLATPAVPPMMGMGMMPPVVPPLPQPQITQNIIPPPHPPPALPTVMVKLPETKVKEEIPTPLVTIPSPEKKEDDAIFPKDSDSYIWSRDDDYQFENSADTSFDLFM